MAPVFSLRQLGPQLSQARSICHRADGAAALQTARAIRPRQRLEAHHRLRQPPWTDPPRWERRVRPHRARGQRKRRPRSPWEGRPGGKPREYRPWDLPPTTPPRLPATLHGAFYHSRLGPLLARINAYLVRWIRKKYKRLRTYTKAMAAWQRITSQHPRLFYHWKWVHSAWQTG